MVSTSTPNRFLVGFYESDVTVQTITEQAVELTKGCLSAVMVFNESTTLGEKFALMAVREPEQLKLVKSQFEGKTVCVDIPDSIDEKDVLFKHRCYILLLLTDSEGKLNLTKKSLDFLIKDVTGGVHIEAAVRKMMTDDKLPALDSLLGVIGTLVPGVQIKSLIVNTEDITEALRFCDIRRQVAQKKKELEASKKK
eukprot:TRINITY_DN6194_c0_g1_i1.p1 TRINITY_DN6194_c0_g1~~TRINITY_DN6194_c0_g1_i1.p1  ORF type:complete len:196 (+),score=43.40 TRINITY_DN6194_c0_g1_i1:46-633(+)